MVCMAWYGKHGVEVNEWVAELDGYGRRGWRWGREKKYGKFGTGFRYIFRDWLIVEL